MKKRKIINIIGIILIVAIFYLAGIFFPNKARIGYYKHIDDKGILKKEFIYMKMIKKSICHF